MSFPSPPETTAALAPPQRAASAIRCVGLVKRWSEVTAVAGIDLEVRTGECFGLLGPNGAGKTTTVEILEGLTRPDAGLVEVLGCRWGAGCDQKLRERMGIQLQETQLAEKLTVEETVRLFQSFYRRGRPVEEVIAAVELQEKQKTRVGKLSGGQKQRLALACALVCDPDLLFLDEPTTGLDPQARLKVWGIIEEFHRRGGTIILTTHYMEEAAKLCNRVAIMDHGRVIALGSPADLIAGLAAEQVLEFSALGAALDPAALSRLPGVKRAQKQDARYFLTVTDEAAALPALLAELNRVGGRLETLTTHQPTLEDVFLSLTGRSLRND